MPSFVYLQQDANLQRVKKGDMKASIHRMEIDRIRFVLSSYLRSRLHKVSEFSPVDLPAILSFGGGWPFVVCQIEKFFPHVLEKEKCRQAGEPSLLSPEEFAFAKEWEQWNSTSLTHKYRRYKLCITQVLQQHGGLPESCGTEADATQPSDCGYAQSWWKFSFISFFILEALLPLSSLTMTPLCSDVYSQFPSLVWTPLCSCGPKSRRRTSWLSLKRTIKGEVHPTETSCQPPLGGGAAYLPQVIVMCEDTKLANVRLIRFMAESTLWIWKRAPSISCGIEL